MTPARPAIGLALGTALLLACGAERGGRKQQESREARDNQSPSLVATPVIGAEATGSGGKAAAVPDRERVAVLTISPPDKLFVDGEPVPAERLQERLAQLFRDRESKTLLIKDGKGLLRDSRIDVMNIARRAGVKNVSIVSVPD